jgi:hypothetical protein
MSSNSAQIVHQLHREFQELIEYVIGEQSQSRTAYEVELTLFKRLLALGAELLRLFFMHRASVRPSGPVHAPDGTELRYHDQRPTTYFSVFGKVRFRRHYFHAPGQEGFCPLDAALSLPPRCYSDLLRDWAEYGVTNEAYDESIKVLERILGLSVSKLALETGVQEDAADVEAFYEQKAVPPPQAEGSILVIQADGKGVPMVRAEPAPQSARRGKGEKRTKKKEAVVTAIYTIEPYFRTPQQVTEALLSDQAENEETQSTATSQPSRPVPVGKEVRATLAGKNIAFERLTQRVAQREGQHIQHRIALTDGAESLQHQVRDRLSRFTLILDIIHALEYLWDAANALLGETSPDRIPWMKEQLLHILSGSTSTVIQTLENCVQDPALSASQRQALHTTIGYYRRNLPYMRYDLCLAQGWPIGTGVVEGACGHLVKDRMQRSAMRWTPSGAQAILDLRAVRINDDWDEYQRFRRHCQHQRLYNHYPIAISVAELFALDHLALVAA